MNFEMASQFVLFFSSTGMLVFIARKIPALIALSEDKKEEGLFIKIRNKMADNYPLKNFSYEMFLQRALTKVRILTLKTDNKTFGWLQILKEKARQKKNLQNGDYWKEVKKIKGGEE